MTCERCGSYARTYPSGHTYRALSAGGDWLTYDERICDLCFSLPRRIRWACFCALRRAGITRHYYRARLALRRIGR